MTNGFTYQFPIKARLALSLRLRAKAFPEVVWAACLVVVTAMVSGFFTELHADELARMAGFPGRTEVPLLVLLLFVAAGVLAVRALNARRIFERMTSYATYRIAETMRLLLFMTAAILIFNFYPVTAIMVVLLALLNDIPIMMIAYDNASFARQPVRWDMTRVLTIASSLGIYGVLESFVLYWIARDYFALPAPELQATIFIKLLISGELTIFLTRNTGWFWQGPLPNLKLVAPCVANQILGTLIVVYGVAMAPIGWQMALFVWGYTLISFFIANAVKIAAYGLIGEVGALHKRHLARIERHVAA